MRASVRVGVDVANRYETLAWIGSMPGPRPGTTHAEWVRDSARYSRAFGCKLNKNGSPKGRSAQDEVIAVTAGVSKRT